MVILHSENVTVLSCSEESYYWQDPSTIPPITKNVKGRSIESYSLKYSNDCCVYT